MRWIEIKDNYYETAEQLKKNELLFFVVVAGSAQMHMQISDEHMFQSNRYQASYAVAMPKATKTNKKSKLV